MKEIDLALIEEIRDDIFTVVKHLYKQGIIGTKANGKPQYKEYLWWMNDEQELLVAENVANSEQVDTIEDVVLGILRQYEHRTAQEIYSNLVGLGIELPQGRATDMRIANIIKRNGIGKAKRLRVGHSQARYYRWDEYWDNKKAEDDEARKERSRAIAVKESVDNAEAGSGAF